MTRLMLAELATLADIQAIAWNLDWHLVKTIKPDENAALEVIWRDHTSDTLIHFIEDSYLDVRYLSMQGLQAQDMLLQIQALLPESAQFAQVISHLRTLLPMGSNQNDASSDIADPADLAQLSFGARCLGLTAPEREHSEAMILFDKLLTHPDPSIRETAIKAAGYPAWASFRPRLERLAISDSDGAVREQAKALVQAILKKYAYPAQGK